MPNNNLGGKSVVNEEKKKDVGNGNTTSGCVRDGRGDGYSHWVGCSKIPHPLSSNICGDYILGAWKQQKEL